MFTTVMCVRVFWFHKPEILEDESADPREREGSTSALGVLAEWPSEADYHRFLRTPTRTYKKLVAF